MPVRFARKEEIVEKLEPEAIITLSNFEKKLEQWEPITLRLLQNITMVSKKLDGFYELIKEGTITGAEIRGWLNVNLRMPLEEYQSTIYTSYKVFLQNIAVEFLSSNIPEGFALAKQARSILNTLKNFEINARIINSICKNIFKIPDNLIQQFHGLQKVLETRLPELRRQVVQQHEDMHALAAQCRTVKELEKARV
ncbi:MAG: hypothetical protein QW165_00765 [Candidatus Woesearchaeota archaeon]